MATIRAFSLTDNDFHLSCETEMPITDELIDAMLNHKMSPKLYLLGEEGHTLMKRSMPFVPEIRIDVEGHVTYNVYCDSFETQRLSLDEIFATFPNLENLSVSVNRLMTDSAVDTDTPSPQIPSLSLPEDATIPPLRSLSLSGFMIHSSDLSTWETRFPWGKLKSLSLGKQTNYGVFEAAIGNVHDMKEFEIFEYYMSWDEPNPTTELEKFLSSFNSLESIIAKGTVPSISSVIHHSNLKHLCLHAVETPICGENYTQR